MTIAAISSRGVKTRDQQPVKEFSMTIKDPQKNIISEHVGLSLN